MIEGLCDATPYCNTSEIIIFVKLLRVPSLDKLNTKRFLTLNLSKKLSWDLQSCIRTGLSKLRKKNAAYTFTHWEIWKTYWKYNVNMGKRVGKNWVFLRLTGLILRISFSLCPQEIPRSSPTSSQKTGSVPPLLLRLTQS